MCLVNTKYSEIIWFPDALANNLCVLFLILFPFCADLPTSSPTVVYKHYCLSHIHLQYCAISLPVPTP